MFWGNICDDKAIIIVFGGTDNHRSGSQLNRLRHILTRSTETESQFIPLLSNVNEPTDKAAKKIMMMMMIETKTEYTKRKTEANREQIGNGVATIRLGKNIIGTMIITETAK